MKSWPAKALLLASVTVALALPALGQDNPESLLPPGFNDPQTQPPPEKATPAPRDPAQPPTPSSPSSPTTPSGDDPNANLIDLEEVELQQMLGPRPTNYFSVPEGSERPVHQVGMLGPGNFGWPPVLRPDFGGRSAALMRSLHAPLPSRWTSICSAAPCCRGSTPRRHRPVNWWPSARPASPHGRGRAARMLVQASTPRITRRG